MKGIPGTRKIATTIIVLSLAAGFTGPAASAKKTITWWMGGWNTLGVFKTLAKEYEAEHPNVKVALVGGNLDKFYAMTTAGLMPDVWSTWGTAGSRADVNRDWVVDLTPYIARDAKQIGIEDFFPGIMRVYRVNGKQYSLPMYVWQDYFFYNTAMYAQAGLMPPPMDSDDKSWNWDRMVSNAAKMAKTDGTGKLRVAGVDFARGIWGNPAYMHIWGAHIYSDAAMRSSVPQQVDWDSPQVLTALTKVHDLIYKLNVATPAGGGFGAGKTGQLIDAGWTSMQWWTSKTLKWAVSNYPWGVTNQAAMWPDGWRMSKVTKDKELVWDFIKFLTSPKSMAFTSTDPTGTVSGSGSARKSVFYKTLAQNLGKVTGMSPSDVLRVTSQADAVGVIVYRDIISLHEDLTPFLEPVMPLLWNNKISPVQASARLQDITNKKLPDLFKRWIRNVKFSGGE